MLTFVETKLLTALVRQCLSDDEYSALRRALVAKPDAGEVIRGSGLKKTKEEIDGGL